MNSEPKESTKKQWIKDGIDCVSSAAGATVGAVIGGALGGPPGVVLGNLAGTALEKAFQAIGAEISSRVLSRSETRKVETVYTLAKEFIAENLNNNRKLREDDFFDEKISGRSSAEEILEGTLLVAQREYEERKLKYLAKLYANIAFSTDITAPTASFLIKLAEKMTYRQILILHCVAIAKYSPAPIPLRKEAYKSVSGLSNVAIASETFDLYRSSILMSSEVIFDNAGINPSALSIGGYGAHLCNLMELNTKSGGDSDTSAMCADIFAFLTGTTVVKE